MRINGKLVFPCVALGLSAFIMQSSESVISVCFNSSLLAYGGDIAVGAMAILTSIMQFAMLPPQGIAQGAQPILSYNYGAGNAERLKKTYKTLLIACLIYSVTLWLAVMLFPRLFVSIFTPDAALIDFAAGALRIYFGGMVLFGIQIACQMTFVALGKAKSSILVAVVRKFILLLPLIFILPNQLIAVHTHNQYIAPLFCFIEQIEVADMKHIKDPLGITDMILFSAHTVLPCLLPKTNSSITSPTRAEALPSSTHP